MCGCQGKKALHSASASRRSSHQQLVGDVADADGLAKCNRINEPPRIAGEGRYRKVWSQQQTGSERWLQSRCNLIGNPNVYPQALRPVATFLAALPRSSTDFCAALVDRSNSSLVWSPALANSDCRYWACS